MPIYINVFYETEISFVYTEPWQVVEIHSKGTHDYTEIHFGQYHG